MFKTINENSTAEIVEKKSKFIANLFYVETTEEAEEVIKQIKKKYYDARHNCFAYRIINEDKIVERFSDDGEPSRHSGYTNASNFTRKRISKYCSYSN